MKGNFETILNDNRPVVVDFHAEWCGPCKIQSPILNEVVSEMGDKIKVIKIDVDRNRELAGRFQIQGVPTLMIFKNGVVKYRQSGVHTKEKIIKAVLTHI